MLFENSKTCSEKSIVIDVEPIGKPRMTRADKWKKRPAVMRYRAFKDELIPKCNVQGIKIIDELHVILRFPMPPSWSQKKKETMHGTKHLNKPDIDNCIKAILDTLVKNDQCVYKVSAEKYWATKGSIEFIL